MEAQMSPGFAILFAAVIVLGVVGGQVMQTVLKELLPLLRTLVEERHSRANASPSSQLSTDLQALEARLSRIEEDHQKLTEATVFLQRLLDERPEHPSVRTVTSAPELSRGGSATQGPSSLSDAPRP
jgi:hypothetical protein